jgi:hypothetical protein
MFGTSSFLALILLTSGTDDAGFVSVSDQTPANNAAADSGEGEVTPASYSGKQIESEVAESDHPSLLQTMLLEQDQKRKPRENPFKEEGSQPGGAIAAPPDRLPPVLPNPPSNQSVPPPPSAPDNPAKLGVPGMAEAGDVGCCPRNSKTDPSISSECPANAIGQRRTALRNWFCDIGFEGWIDQGVTINPYSPRDRSNFPVGFNNRSNEYQLNQAYLRFQRKVNPQGGRWDVGGTVDLLYGTDSFYASSRGLEVNRDFSPKWNAQQYGAALPQCYMEVVAPWGDDGLSMKLGHFYTILGYETTPAPENFFYSHSYNLIYGEPVTETGLLAEKKVGNFKFQAGMTRGWDNWEDNNNDMSFLGGVSWSNDDNTSSLAFAMQSGPEQNEPPRDVNFRNIFSLVYQQKLGESFQYVCQYDFGYEERSDIFQLPPAKWNGLGQYLFYTINEKWRAGMRFEWFRDESGIRVPRGVPNGDYYELTAGLNWLPSSRVSVRPEIRYDWVGTPNLTPFVDASKSYQLLLDCDVIVKF